MADRPEGVAISKSMKVARSSAPPAKVCLTAKSVYRNHSYHLNLGVVFGVCGNSTMHSMHPAILEETRSAVISGLGDAASTVPSPVKWRVLVSLTSLL